MSYRDELKNPLFRNWVRGGLALKYLKRGLVDHIDQSVKTQHALFIGSLTNTSATGISCGVCTLGNLLPGHAGKRCIQKLRSKCFCSNSSGRRKCPMSYCSIFADLVIQEHWLKDPVWSNSDPTVWLTQYWELAKCFLSTPGKSNAHSAKDADAADLLIIAINNSSIRNSIQTIDNFIKARHDRNHILHSGSFELQDAELADYIQTFIDVLLDASVIHQHAAQNAIKDLKQVKNDNIVISLEDVEEMRTNALNAIEEKKEEAMQSLTDEVEHKLDEMNKKAEDLRQALSLEKDQILHDVEEKIEAEKVRAVAHIDEHKSDSIAVLNDKKSNIQYMTENSVREFTRKISNRGEEMKGQLMLDIRHYLKGLTDAVLQDYEKYRYSKLEEMKERSERAYLEFEQNKENLLQKLLEKINQKLEDIETKHAEEISNVTKRIKDKVCKEIDAYIQENAIIVEGQYWSVENIPDHEETNQHITNPRIKMPTDKSKFVILVPPSHEEMQYSKTKQEFRNDLLSFYRRHKDIGTINMTPLSRTHDAPLLQVFVRPDMTFTHDKGSQKAFSVNSYRDILFHESKRVRNVIISGPADTGKSVLARHICVTWCEAHEPQSGEASEFREDDVEALRDFDFLFLINLGNAMGDCEIHDMIRKQIVNELSQAHIYSKNDFLQNILSKEKCIIINDTLDRWSHPDPNSNKCQRQAGILPHIHSGENVTVVSMTRHWALHIHDLNFKQMDMNVELVNDSEKTFIALTRRTVSHLNSLCERDKNEEDFLTLVDRLNLKTSPFTRLGHIHMICQWFEDKTSKKSRTELYGYLTDVLLEKYNSTLSVKFMDYEETSNTTRSEGNSTVLNQSLKVYMEPKQLNLHTDAILKLGKLSLESMLSAKTEVLDISCPKDFLSRDEVQFGIDLGILTVKVTRKLTSENVALSFENPTHQAYFAARYVATIHLATVTEQTIAFSCRQLNKKPVSDCLVFLAGLNPSLLRDISKSIYVVDNESMNQYRNASYAIPLYENRLRYLQDIFVECVREMSSHNRDSPSVVPYIEDIFIDKACKNKIYCSDLSLLISRNIGNIKSVTIDPSSLTQDILASVQKLSHSSPQKLAVLSKNQRTASVKTYQSECSNELFDIIQSFMSKASGDLKCVSIADLSLSPQKFDSIVNTGQIPVSYVRQVQVLETGDHRRGIRDCKISFNKCIRKPYLFLGGDASYDVINKTLVNQLAHLKIVNLQNISITPSQLESIGDMNEVDILNLWHARLTDPMGNSSCESSINIPDTFDVNFDRKKSSIVLRGKVPNSFVNTFIANNSRDLKTIKVVYVYLKFESLYSLCCVNKQASLTLNGITLISEEDKCRKARYFAMRTTFKCEYQSPQKKVTISGFAPEPVYEELIKIYGDMVMQIELRDVFLSQNDLGLIAGMKEVNLLALVNITCTPTSQAHSVTILNTFDMIYTREEQKIYVCGDINSEFFNSIIFKHSVRLKVADLRYLTKTTECLHSLEYVASLQELSLFFCKSDFDDTPSVITVLKAVSGALQFVQIGCHLLLSKYYTECKNHQQSESMSIREVIHYSKTIDLKRDQDLASLNESFCLQWDNRNMSLYIEGQTPEQYIHHFLQMHTTFTTLALKDMFLSKSGIEELQNAENLKVLRLTDVTYEEIDNEEENLYNKENDAFRRDTELDYSDDDDDDDDDDKEEWENEDNAYKHSREEEHLKESTEERNCKVEDLKGVNGEVINKREASTTELTGNSKEIEANSFDEDENQRDVKRIEGDKIGDKLTEKRMLTCDVDFDFFKRNFMYAEKLPIWGFL